VIVKMDKKAGIGSLSCKACTQDFSTQINHLSAPVDVYYDWVDEAEKMKTDSQRQNSTQRAAPGDASRINAPAAASGSGYAEKDKEDDFIVDDEDEAEGGFGDDKSSDAVSPASS